MIAAGIYVLKVSLCLLVFYLLYSALLKRTTFFHFNRIYLLLSLFCSWIIPLLSIPVFENHYTLASPEFFPAIPLAMGDEDSSIIANPATIDSGLNYTYLLFIVYSVTVLGLFARFFFFILRMTRLRKNSVSYSRNGLTLVKTDLPQPFSFLNWIFIPRYDIHPFILRHEEVHVRQLHWIDLIIVEVMAIVLWFNPVLLLYRRSIKLQHEYLADSYTIDKVSPSIEAYLDCLVNQVCRVNSFQPVSQFYSKSIKNRIVMITKNKTSRKFYGIYLLVLPVTGLMLFAFSGQPSAPAYHEVSRIIAEDNRPSIAPVEMQKTVVGAGYGERIHPETKKKQMHQGIDLILAEGEPIIATAGGVVLESVNEYPNDPFYERARGKYIVIKHDDTYTTSYFHLSNAIVKVGDPIKKGQKIGYVGSTGLSKYPHLHYAVIKNGRYVDPQDYLPKTN